MKDRNLKRLAVPLCFVFVLALGVVQGADREKYEEKFEKTETLALDGKVHLGNISGDIEIRTWKENSVKIDALKVSQASSQAKAKENAREVTIEVTRDGSTLKIETKYPQRNKFWGNDSINVSVHYKLSIPEKASVSVKSISGDVRIEPVGGRADVSSTSGDVTVLGAMGLEAVLVSGDIRVRDVAGGAFLKTVSGDVRAEKIRGNVDAESVSGDVDLMDIAGAANAEAKTVSGDITFTGDIQAEGQYRFRSHSGDVEMRLPANAAFDFEAKTFSGVIDSDFEIQVVGKLSQKDIRGTVNKGGATVRLTTFSGNIDLKKK